MITCTILFHTANEKHRSLLLPQCKAHCTNDKLDEMRGHNEMGEVKERENRSELHEDHRLILFTIFETVYGDRVFHLRN